MFEIKYGFEESWLDQTIAVFNKTAMKRNNPTLVLNAFKNSQIVASVWSDKKLLGFGRMITDFSINSAIFDLVIDPDFQKQGLGKLVMESLMAKAPGTRFYLTSTEGNEPFYYKLGFRFHKTAMALYPESTVKSNYLDWERKP